MDKKILIDTVTDIILRNMAKSYFSYVSKYEKSRNKSDYISNYQLFISLNTDKAKEFANYLYDNGFLMYDGSVFEIAYRLTDISFKIFNDEDHFMMFGQSESFSTKYIELLYESVNSSVDFLDVLFAQGLAQSDNVTKITLDMMDSYYTSLDNTDKLLYQRTSTPSGLLREEYDVFEQMYPENYYFAIKEANRRTEEDTPSQR